MRTPEEIIEDLTRLAEWFDSPNESPGIAVEVSRYGQSFSQTPGYLLRRIRDRLEEEIRPIEGWSG